MSSISPMAQLWALAVMSEARSMKSSSSMEESITGDLAEMSGAE